MQKEPKKCMIKYGTQIAKTPVCVCERVSGALFEMSKNSNYIRRLRSHHLFSLSFSVLAAYSHSIRLRFGRKTIKSKLGEESVV